MITFITIFTNSSVTVFCDTVVAVIVDIVIELFIASFAHTCLFYGNVKVSHFNLVRGVSV